MVTIPPERRLASAHWPIPAYARQRLNAYAWDPERAITDAGIRAELWQLCELCGERWREAPMDAVFTRAMSR